MRVISYKATMAKEKDYLRTGQAVFLLLPYMMKQLIKISPLCIPGFMKNLPNFGQSQIGTLHGRLGQTVPRPRKQLIPNRAQRLKTRKGGGG